MVGFPFDAQVSVDGPVMTVGSHTYTYHELARDIAAYEFVMAKRNAFFWAEDDPYKTLVLYLTCLKVGTCIGVLPRGSNMEPMKAFVSQKVPASLLVTTSGSTGNKKFVKLTRGNLESNCAAICESLPILPTDVAGLMLPMSYSYGLSVVNTHLRSHAHVHVMTTQFGSKRFWQELVEKKVSSLALVPSHLASLKLGSFEMLLPKTLRYITVAGGALDKLGLLKVEAIRARGVETYVMYGQTEATARIACLPSNMFLTKRGSVGRPISGTLTLDPETNEVIYDGPNVFAGYATQPSDMLTLDRPVALRTGDVGRLDADGYLWITGRLKRIAKINSQRVSLDELEQLLSEKYDASVKCVSNDRLVYCCSTVDLPRPDVLPGSIVMVRLDELPMTSTGKVDYVKLLEVACSRT